MLSIESRSRTANHASSGVPTRHPGIGGGSNSSLSDRIPALEALAVRWLAKLDGELAVVASDAVAVAVVAVGEHHVARAEVGLAAATAVLGKRDGRMGLGRVKEGGEGRGKRRERGKGRG